MSKRSQTADLTGKVALVTGGRIKIGYEACLILLRAGATVIVTTRFPRDAAARYSREDDFDAWKERLHIYALDLRVLIALERFIQHLKDTFPRLDILVNNAAQTIRRPPAFYAHLMPLEKAPLAQIATTTRSSEALNMVKTFARHLDTGCIEGPNATPNLAVTNGTTPSASVGSDSSPDNTLSRSDAVSGSLVPRTNASDAGFESSMAIMGAPGAKVTPADLSQVILQFQCMGFCRSAANVNKARTAADKYHQNSTQFRM